MNSNVFKALMYTFACLLLLDVVDFAYDKFHRLVVGKASYSNEAVYRLPDSPMEVVLERRGIHLFLAEYERTLVLRNGSSEHLRKELAIDTGGYSRLNIYQLSRNEYFLSGDLSFDRYLLNVADGSLENTSLEEKPATARFIGLIRSGRGRLAIYSGSRARGTEEQD